MAAASFADFLALFASSFAIAAKILSPSTSLNLTTFTNGLPLLSFSPTQPVLVHVQ